MVVKQRSGNSGKKYGTTEPGPWMEWPETDPAERCIRFISTFCRAPKGYGFGEPLRLAAFQRSWIREVIGDPAVIAALMSVGRGQGKSTLLAGIGTWATFDRSASGAPQVPVVATTVGQAIKSVYGVAVAMVEAEPELAARSRLYTAISNTRIDALGGGEMFPIANDPDTLQGLDPSLAIMDEIGFQPRASFDSLYLASGKREWSKIVGIGTPGFDRDNALWQIRASLKEGGDIPGLHFKEFAADEDGDHRDRAQWLKANPALGEGFMRMEALEAAVRLSPEAHFRIFRLGQWVDGVESWLGEDGRAVWRALVDPWDLVPGAPTWGGLDVGLKRDSTALVLVQRRPDGRLHVACKIWLPTDDETVDLADIMKYIREVDAEFNLRALAYDPRLFELPAQMLADEGIRMVENPQSLERMTPAFGDLYEDIKRGAISVNDHVAFEQQVLNGVPRWNQSGFTLQKAKSRGRIDAAYALAMGTNMARHPEPEAPTLVAL